MTAPELAGELPADDLMDTAMDAASTPAESGSPAVEMPAAEKAPDAAPKAPAPAPGFHPLADAAGFMVCGEPAVMNLPAPSPDTATQE